MAIQEIFKLPDDEDDDESSGWLSVFLEGAVLHSRISFCERISWNINCLDCPLTLRVKCTVRFTAKHLVYQSFFLTSAIFLVSEACGGRGSLYAGCCSEIRQNGKNGAREFPKKYWSNVKERGHHWLLSLNKKGLSCWRLLGRQKEKVDSVNLRQHAARYAP